MLKKLMFSLFSFLPLGCSQKVNIQKEYKLPKEVSETSGLLWVNKNTIITHNDSGSKPELYVVDLKKEKVVKKVKLANATCVDWEDIAQDEQFIYVADLGNNDGNREDLCVYKVLKADFWRTDKVEAKQIRFRYEDQTDFSYQRHKTNFDCEAITLYNGKLLLFTKNWGDEQTKMYQINTEDSNQVAQKISTHNVKQLITGASYNPKNKALILSGYNRAYEPVFRLVNNFNLESELAKSKTIPVYKTLGAGNQTEGIDFTSEGNIAFTREKLYKKADGKKHKHKAKLYILD